MHVADQLFAEAFEVRIDGKQTGPGAVFPDWSPLDRFGIVVTEPLGGLGASLLLQLAIALFYSVRPDRRAGAAMYPEIYLFHVGGPHGDFSYFDFWPPRKEVRVAAAAPVSLLEAVNAHAITRLAVPLGDTGAESVLRSGPGTWAEQASAMDRLRSCFGYACGGHVAGGDVRLSSRDPREPSRPATGQHDRRSRTSEHHTGDANAGTPPAAACRSPISASGKLAPS